MLSITVSKNIFEMMTSFAFKKILSFPPRLEIFAVQKREGWVSMIKDIKSDKNIGETSSIKAKQRMIPESEL